MVYLSCQLALAPLQPALQCYCAHRGWHCCDAWFMPSRQARLHQTPAVELYHRNMIYVLFHPVPFLSFFVTNWLPLLFSLGLESRSHSDGSEEGPGQAWGMMRMMRKQKARWARISNQHRRHVITFKWSGCLVALLHF